MTDHPPDEWTGDPFHVHVQKILFERREWLRARHGLFSQGRSLLVFDGGRSDADLLELVETFRRVIVIGPIETIDARSILLERSESSVMRNLLLLSREIDAAGLDELQGNEVQIPEGWSIHDVPETAGPALVHAVQELHDRCDVRPLPGTTIRGIAPGISTVTMYDDRGELAGCATIQDCSGDGDDGGEAMILAICIRPEHQGRGLSIVLNRAAMKRAVDTFGAKRILEIVEDGNAPSLAMNRHCGLVPENDRGVFFAEWPYGSTI
jgi:RimJ/RimL family protein N-acetyltransferase